MLDFFDICVDAVIGLAFVDSEPRPSTDAAFDGILEVVKGVEIGQPFDVFEVGEDCDRSDH